MKKSIVNNFFKALAIVILFELFTQIGIAYFNVTTWDILLKGKYNRELIAEMIALVFAIIVALILKRKDIFKNPKRNFLEGIRYGGPITWMAIFFTITNSIKLINTDININNFLSMTIFIIFVGLFEEIFYRGIIQNELMSNSNNNKKSVVLSLLISSIIFGLGHISNLFYGQQLFETIIQVFQTTAIGLILGIAYYKSKNIYSVAFIHFLYDFSIMLDNVNLYKDCTYASNIDIISMFAMSGVTIGLILIYFTYSYIVINKLDFENSKKITKKKETFLITFAMVASIWIFIGSSFLLNKNMDNNYICYNYESVNIEKYELIYYSYKDFKIDNININLNNNKVVIKDNYNLSENIIDIDNVYSLIAYSNENVINITFITVYLNEYKVYSINVSSDNLDDIKNISNYNNIIIPTVKNIGYIKDYENDIIYPFIKTTNEDIFIIDNDKALILNK